jgi:hypothetical protein
MRERKRKKLGTGMPKGKVMPTGKDERNWLHRRSGGIPLCRCGGTRVAAVSWACLHGSESAVRSNPCGTLGLGVRVHGPRRPAPQAAASRRRRRPARRAENPQRSVRGTVSTGSAGATQLAERIAGRADRTARRERVRLDHGAAGLGFAREALCEQQDDVLVRYVEHGSGIAGLLRKRGPVKSVWDPWA